MKKNTKQFLLLLTALILLLAVFFALKQYNRLQTQLDGQTENAGLTVIAADKENITKLAYGSEKAKFSFEKEGDIWYYIDNKSVNIDQQAIDAMLDVVAPLVVKQQITDVTDMSQYGLDEPVISIQFETESERFTIDVGKLNEISSVYYIRIPEETTVYTLHRTVMAAFDKTVDELVAKEETTGEQ